MTIECPQCGEKVEYEPGAVQICSYCKVSLRLPEVNQLPEDLRNQWLQEQAAIKARKAKQLKKLETAKQRRKEEEQRQAEEAARQKKEREEQERQREEERKRRAERMEDSAKLRAAAKAKEIPERNMADSYPGLATVKSVFDVIMALCIIGAVLGGFGALIMFGDQDTRAGAPFVLGFSLGLAGMALWYWCVAELLQLAINLARDVKIGRELLTRLVHPDKVE